MWVLAISATADVAMYELCNIGLTVPFKWEEP